MTFPFTGDYDLELYGLPGLVGQVYLIRHAEPDWSRTDIPYHQPPGPPLTERGLAEGYALARFLQEAGICQIYTSPLQRCQHTAQIAAEAWRAPLQIEQDLIELQPGEARLAVCERVQRLFEIAARQSQECGPVAIFTHGGTIDAALSFLGLESERLERLRVFDYKNPVPTAGAWWIRRETTSQPWRVALVFKPEVASVG